MVQHTDVASRGSRADLRGRVTAYGGPLALPGCAAAFALAAAMALAPTAVAQTQCWPTEINGAEGGILDGSFGEQTLQVRACAEGEVLIDQGSIPTVVLTPPDPFDPDTGFSTVFDVQPCGLAGGSDLPGAELTVKFISETTAANTSSVLTLQADKDKPTLTTTSQPANGTKVKPGDAIKVKMRASEEYNDPRYNWQTGVKKIQLTDESRNQIVPPHFEGAEMRPCAEKQWKQTLEITYTVPPNPPPIIRLRAVAEDFAGNQDFDVGEFPTGDWFGTIKKTAKGGGHNHRIDIDLAFEIDTGETIKGRAHARIRTEAGEVPGCTMLWTYEPGEFDIPLSGRRDGESFEIEIAPATVTATTTSVAGACKGGGGQESATFPSHLNPAVYAAIKYRISAQDGATDTIELNAGELPWGVIMTDTIEIHQVPQ